MDILFGTTVVTNAGTRVQLSNTARDVKWLTIKTRVANTGRMFVGLVDVSATVNGWELESPLSGGTRLAVPIAEKTIPFDEGSVKLNLFYADATVGGERVDWIALLR